MPSPKWGICYETEHFNLPLASFPGLARESRFQNFQHLMAPNSLYPDAVQQAPAGGTV